MRRYEPKDYEMLCSWWKSKDFPCPPEVILPTTGYVCDEIAAGFLYLSNSALAYVEWVVADPNADKQKRSEALDKLFDHVFAEAKKAGAIMLFTSSNIPPYMERVKKLGFMDGDKQTNHFIKVL